MPESEVSLHKESENNITVEFISKIGCKPISEKEFLIETAKLFKECPICGAADSIEAEGLDSRWRTNVVKCRSCETSWHSVTMTNKEEGTFLHGFKEGKGEHYLKIYNLSNKHKETEVLKGKKPFPVEFWTDPTKTRKYIEYVHTILKAVAKLRNAPKAVCNVKVKDKTNCEIYGPSGDLVLLLMPSVEGVQVSTAIMDVSPSLWGKPEKEEANDSFYLLLNMLVNSIKERLEKQGKPFDVDIWQYNPVAERMERKDKNLFYPSNTWRVSIPSFVMQGLRDCGVVVQTGHRQYEFNFWDDED